MALIACSECQKEISDKATSCPHCGAPVPPSAAAKGANSAGRLLKLAFVLMVGYFVYKCSTIAGIGESPSAQIEQARAVASPTPPPQAPASPPVQKELDRMGALSPEHFCSRELRKLKGMKSPYPQPWYEAIERASKTHGVKPEHLPSIQAGGAVIGMNMCAAMAAWGRPQSVNRSTYSFATKEQWVYGGRNYLYFTDDRLDSIQN